MRLLELKETTSHGLRWNNSPVSPVVLLFCFFLQRFGICILSASMWHKLIIFSRKTHGQHNIKGMR